MQKQTLDKSPLTEKCKKDTRNHVGRRQNNQQISAWICMLTKSNDMKWNGEISYTISIKGNYGIRPLISNVRSI